MRRLRYQRANKFAAKFVANGFNAQQAVIDCGITENRNSAHVIGWRLLKHPAAQKAIKQHMSDAKMSADEVLERLTKVARTDVEFKGSDVVKAAELLGKGHKLFVDKVETADITEHDSLKQIISGFITDLSDDFGLSRAETELKLQTSYANRNRKAYRPDLDPTVHPELWESGNLLTVVDAVEPSEVSG